MRYRVREKSIRHDTVVCTYWRRMFIAEKSMRLFGVHLFWFPMVNSCWRYSIVDARRDAVRHAEARLAPSMPEIIEMRLDR